MSALDRVHVLLVDDHAEMRSLVRTMLGEIGFGNIEAAADGAEAYRRFCEHPAELVVTDLRMQPVDGIALTRMIRTAPDSPNRAVPIMILSGDPAESAVMQARDAGATDFLARPCSTDTLFAHLCKIIEKPRDFIDNESYVGPNRRRRSTGSPAGPERRRFNW